MSNSASSCLPPRDHHEKFEALRWRRAAADAYVRRIKMIIESLEITMVGKLSYGIERFQ